MDSVGKKDVGLIILAAGASTRMGSPKQLLAYNNTNLLQYTINEAIKSSCDPIVLVLGAYYERIYPQVENNPVHIVNNPDWEEGMASSLRKGIKSILALRSNLKGVVILLCDQPYVTSDQINKLVEASDTSDKTIVVSEYDNVRGVPVLFHFDHFDELARLQGKEGAKTILKKYQDCILRVPFPRGNIDVDTPEDYSKIKQ